MDSDRLRREFFPALLETRLAQLQQPSGFPPLRVTLDDSAGQAVVRGYEHGEQLDERTFPLVFFDRQLLEYSAPYEAHREIWRLQTSYGDATPGDRQRQHAPAADADAADGRGDGRSACSWWRARRRARSGWPS